MSENVNLTYDGGWKLLHDIKWLLYAVVFLLLVNSCLLLAILFELASAE